MDVFDGLIDLAFWLVPGGRFHQPEIQCRFSSFRRDFQHVVFARITPAGFQSVSSRGELLHERFEFFRGRSVPDGWLFAFKLGSRQFEHGGGLHVGSRAEHLHEFGHVDETGKAGVETVAEAQSWHARWPLPVAAATNGRAKSQAKPSVFRSAKSNLKR